ncbi:MAG: histone-like protein [archaeon]
MALIVKSKIKKFVDLNVGEEVARALEMKVEEILKKAEERAKANQRRTIYARDL